MAVDSMVPIGRGQRELIIGQTDLPARPPLRSIPSSTKLKLINRERSRGIQTSVQYIVFMWQLDKRTPMLPAP